MPASVEFVYSGIRVRDVARSIRFYRRLGFTVVQRGSFSHGGRYVHLALPGSSHRLELNFYPKGSRYYEPFPKGAAFDHFGFSAADPEAWLASARRAGAKFVLGYADRPGQQLYFVRDPDGVWLGVYGPRRPVTSTR
ncbi:MAG: VOC family protein, partial [Thermoplasmata archaeon]|nr:VOC family protein [Thermoplasmata archaeon]